jgi:LPXTG-motif cell wall-anchored protein
VTFVPEPSTATMMIVGGLLASIGVLGRRFRRKDTV